MASDPSSGRGFLDTLPQVDKAKAMRLLIFGLILTIIAVTILLASRTVSAGATNWQNLAQQENSLNFWSGLYGSTEYAQRNNEILLTVYWMRHQATIFSVVGRIGMNVGLLMMILGFIFLAMNNTIDEKTRHVFLIVGAALVLIVMFGVFFAGFNLTINYS